MSNLYTIKDLKKMLKENVSIIINKGPDEYNIAKLTPYHEKEHGHLQFEEITIISENCLGVNIL